MQEALFAQPWRSLTETRLLDWHAQLSSGIERMAPGRYRAGEITFGSHFGVPQKRVQAEVRKVLRQFREQHMQILAGQEGQERGLALVRLSAWLHAELIRIHPMQDGNGRLARLVQATLLVSHGLPVPVFQVRLAYLGALNKYLVRGDLGPLSQLTLTGLQPDT